MAVEGSSEAEEVPQSPSIGETQNKDDENSQENDRPLEQKNDVVSGNTSSPGKIFIGGISRETTTGCKIETVLNGLRKLPKEIPDSLLYEGEGSQIFEEITRLDDYYVFNAERDLLEEYAMDMANAIIPGSLFVELGCGSARKTAPLLNAIKNVHGRCVYAGIDISESALNEARRNLSDLVAGLEPNDIELIHKDFLQGLAQVKRYHPDQALCIAWFGASVGNLTNEDTVEFLKEIISIVGSSCQLLLAMDMWKNPETFYSAYCDKQGVTQCFARNAMQNALSCIGYTPDPHYVNSWTYNVEINQNLKRVEKYLTFPWDLTLESHQLAIRAGERIYISFSTK